MSILTEEDIRAAGGIVHRDGNVFFTNVEKLNEALLAKLAGMELPEPITYIEHDGIRENLYTAAQLHQAFAQGAASQLMARPSGWRCQSRKYPNQCCIAMNEQTSDDATEVTPLYTLKEPK